MLPQNFVMVYKERAICRDNSCSACSFHRARAAESGQACMTVLSCGNEISLFVWVAACTHVHTHTRVHTPQRRFVPREQR